MNPFRTLRTVLEMIKFGWFDVKLIVFSDLQCWLSWRVSRMSARRMIWFAGLGR